MTIYKMFDKDYYVLTVESVLPFDLIERNGPTFFFIISFIFFFFSFKMQTRTV